MLVKQYLKKLFRPLFCWLAKRFDSIVAPNGYADNYTKAFIHNEDEIKRIHPVHLSDLHKKFYKDAPGITHKCERTFLRVLENAKVFQGQGFVINNKNQLYRESNTEDGRDAFLMKNFFYQKPLFLGGINLLISGRDSSSNYFHWITDAIPKLSISENAGFKLQDFDKIIVSNDSLNFQLETLSHLKIESEKVVSLSKNSYVICERLIAPSATCLSGNVSPWIVKYLRGLFTDYMVVNDSLPKKIFIGRKNSKRILLNEGEVSVILKSEGFEKIFSEDLSLRKQIEYFYNADEIIGVHGAGLTNLIFSKQGTIVTELFPVTYVNQCYWTIASHNNLKYSYLTGEGNDTTDELNHQIDSDFYISVEKLMRLRQRNIN